MSLFTQYSLEKCNIILVMVALFEIGPVLIFSVCYSKKYRRKSTVPIIGLFLSKKLFMLSGF